MNYAAAVLGRFLFTFLAIQQFSESAPLKVKRNTCEKWGASESIIENYRILENLIAINATNCNTSTIFKWADVVNGDLEGFNYITSKNDRKIIEVQPVLTLTLPGMKNMSLVDLLDCNCSRKCLQAKTGIVNLLDLVSLMVSGLWHVCMYSNLIWYY